MFDSFVCGWVSAPGCHKIRKLMWVLVSTTCASALQDGGTSHFGQLFPATSGQNGQLQRVAQPRSEGCCRNLPEAIETTRSLQPKQDSKRSHRPTGASKALRKTPAKVALHNLQMLSLLNSSWSQEEGTGNTSEAPPETLAKPAMHVSHIQSQININGSRNRNYTAAADPMVTAKESKRKSQSRGKLNLSRKDNKTGSPKNLRETQTIEAMRRLPILSPANSRWAQEEKSANTSKALPEKLAKEAKRNLKMLSQVNFSGRYSQKATDAAESLPEAKEAMRRSQSQAEANQSHVHGKTGATLQNLVESRTKQPLRNLQIQSMGESNLPPDAESAIASTNLPETKANQDMVDLRIFSLANSSQSFPESPRGASGDKLEAMPKEAMRKIPISSLANSSLSPEVEPTNASEAGPWIMAKLSQLNFSSQSLDDLLSAMEVLSKVVDVMRNLQMLAEVNSTTWLPTEKQVFASNSLPNSQDVSHVTLSGAHQENLTVASKDLPDALARNPMQETRTKAAISNGEMEMSSQVSAAPSHQEPLPGASKAMRKPQEKDDMRSVPTLPRMNSSSSKQTAMTGESKTQPGKPPKKQATHKASFMPKAQSERWQISKLLGLSKRITGKPKKNESKVIKASSMPRGTVRQSANFQNNWPQGSQARTQPS